MKPLSHIIRRTHLYLGLFCLPWFVLYGITSIAFSHPDWFESGPNLYNTANNDAWTEEGSWPCTIAVPETGLIPSEIAAELVEIAGLDDRAFGAYRSGERRVEVYFPAFWNNKRLTYRMEEQRLFLYSRDEKTAQQVLTSMHARAGYQHDSFFDDAWAFMVDLVCIGFLTWVVTGIYIWWHLPAMHKWGAAALLAGFLSFAAFMLLL